MKFSAWFSASTPWSDLVSEFQHAEQTGWDGAWIADHFMPNAEANLGPVQEAWTTLAGLGALVPRLHIGTMVTCNTYRHPAVLAKEVAQVDVITGGRVVLGIGAGWQENEHAAYGITLGSPRERSDRLEEAVQIIRSLFDNERTTFKGKYYAITDAPLAPKPVQTHLPILVGGGGEQRTLRTVARYADEWNSGGAPAAYAEKLKVLAEHCEKVGRDPKSIRLTTQASVRIVDDASKSGDSQGRVAPVFSGTVEQVRDRIGIYQDLGIAELILPGFGMGASVEERRENYDRFIEDVAPAFRS
jgi:F420-dependent oxidoreductase-like protein